nr:MAG TPA: hypothetical protein [Caudoviricetes sp.]
MSICRFIGPLVLRTFGQRCRSIFGFRGYVSLIVHPVPKKSGSSRLTRGFTATALVRASFLAHRSVYIHRFRVSVSHHP